MAELKDFKGFSRMNEQEDERFTGNINADKDIEGEESRLFDEGHGRRMELVKMIQDLTEDVKKYNPTSQENYEDIKEEIRAKKDAIMNHPDFNTLKNEGLPWQDSRLYLDDLLSPLKTAVNILAEKVAKKGLY